jgi:thioredoxin-related protein
LIYVDMAWFEALLAPNNRGQTTLTFTMPRANTALPDGPRRAAPSRWATTLLRLRLCLWALALLVWLPAHGETALPVPGSLQQAAAVAQAKGEPLVLLVSLPGCVWCELVRKSYLLPMRQEGVHAYQITVSESGQTLIGFDGKPTNAAELTTRYNAKLTPTVLLLGPQGQELAERISGVASPDFYGAVLEDRLASARKKLAR